MKISKILLSTSLVLPLAILPTVVSCSNEEGEVVGPTINSYNVTNTDPLANIYFNWTGQKNKKIQCSIDFKGDKTISTVNNVIIDNDGNFTLKVRYIGQMPNQSYTSNFQIVFKYDLNGKQVTQKSDNFSLNYSYISEPEPEPETASNFIYNRSFSLMGIGLDKYQPEYSSLCWGTAWILADATKDVFDDYKYYVATNWHVKYGIDEIKKSVVPSTFKVCYGHSQTELDPSKDYYQLTEYAPITPESTFTYNGLKSNAIDFYVAKVDFGSNPSGTIINNLDFVNALQRRIGYTTKTARTTKITKFNDLPTYMGGYPVRNEYYATWGFQEISPNYLDYFDYNSDYIHGVDDYGSIIDVSPNYIMYDYARDPDWMPGGASGSMLIAQIENEWQVIAIYWGGFVDDEYTPIYFWPAFSIFNSDYKDFTEGY